MPTLSFDVTLCSPKADIDPPRCGYTITLQGDRGSPSDDEYRCVLAGTAGATHRLVKNPATASHPAEMRLEEAELELLHSTHYTWQIVRNDHEPLTPSEVQFALLMHAQNRYDEMMARENAFVFTLSSLTRLLQASKGEMNAFVAALAVLGPAEDELDFDNEAAAAALVKRGLMTATDIPGRFLLKDVEVR